MVLVEDRRRLIGRGELRGERAEHDDGHEPAEGEEVAAAVQQPRGGGPARRACRLRFGFGLGLGLGLGLG